MALGAFSFGACGGVTVGKGAEEVLDEKEPQRIRVVHWTSGRHQKAGGLLGFALEIFVRTTGGEGPT